MIILSVYVNPKRHQVKRDVDSTSKQYRIDMGISKVETVSPMCHVLPGFEIQIHGGGETALLASKARDEENVLQGAHLIGAMGRQTVVLERLRVMWTRLSWFSNRRSALKHNERER